MTDRSSARTVERYYDFIYFWSQATTRWSAFRNPGSHTIHRGLADPDTGEYGTHTIHDLMARELRPLGPITALDAGCGYGGSLIALHERLGGTWHGVTITRKQVEVARRNITALGLGGSLAVELASYDDPQPQRFDVVYGIESLIHSPDPARSIANLARALRPGGLFMIVDDMPAEPFPEAYAADLEGFKRGWKCPVAPSAEGWTAHLAAAGCTLVSARDLTPLTRPRPEPEIVTALAEVARKRWWRAAIGLSLVSDAQAGGLHLERLLAANAIRYTMLIARKDG